MHQALCVNGIRQKVILRCSGANQTGSDVVKAALLGGDSFEFGTTALMMLKCVMAKNCNIKCPAGLTTNPEVFDGDPRALAQYLLNLIHEVREILARLGLRSLADARGRSDLLHLLDHPSSVGRLDLRAMLQPVEEVKVSHPIYLEKDFSVDDQLLEPLRDAIFKQGKDVFETEAIYLNNRHKSVGGQLAIDIERALNYEFADQHIPTTIRDHNGRVMLRAGTVSINTTGSAGQSYAAFCNSGMKMTHVGTCNDGVGKGICGGEIIVVPPEVNKHVGGDNVLIGNFALFGATGGRLFVEGKAGDRFAVRNSGATAVVEGVGDFCAEYMTNGAVLNLGEVTKGFGNGMSGGFAYQYDPDGVLPGVISKDSVLIGSILDDTDNAKAQYDAVYQLLTWHVEATQSLLGRRLLDNWESEKQHFYFLMPRALLQYQDADAILASKTRKELLDELATGLAEDQVSRFKQAWRTGEPINQGKIPGYGDVDTQETFALLNHWMVLHKAQNLAVKRLGGGVLAESAEAVKAARNLILTEDFALMSELLKHGRKAIDGYLDEELAVLVSNKRLNDFKRALHLRTVISMDSPGLYGWIIQLDRKNRKVMGDIPSYDELFANQGLPALTAASM